MSRNRWQPEFHVPAVVVALLLCVTNAFAQSDLAEQGEVVFSEVAGLGCKSCHGEYGEGDLGVGPFIRGATEGSIRAAVEGIGEMVAVRVSIKDEEIAAVAAYLAELGGYQVARTLAKRGRFLPGSMDIYPGTNVQVIIKNSGVAAATFTSDDMDIGDMTIPGRSTAEQVWQAPGEEGSYSIYCTDCKLKDQFYTINVTSSAKQFLGSMPDLNLTPVDTK
jgi:mono/diheme cytochrome c family protein